MTRPLPAPKNCDTTEEARAYWADVARDAYYAELDQPEPGEE